MIGSVLTRAALFIALTVPVATARLFLVETVQISPHTITRAVTTPRTACGKMAVRIHRQHIDLAATTKESP